MRGTSTIPSLDVVPDEVLQHILFYITPRDTLLSILRVSKRLDRLGSEPLLWRYYCRVNFIYWDSRHRIQQKFQGSVADVDWKKLFKYRSNVDTQTTELLDGILDGQINRIKRFDAIGEFGYDAKDTLLRHCCTSEVAEDVLARRYYATAVLDHVHRSKALAEWFKLACGEPISLERALGSFDMFVLHDQAGDLLEICDLFDNLAARLRTERPGLQQFSPRNKALAVATFLRSNNLTGLNSELTYRDLQNNYIGIALQREDHPSLPLISVAIFCAVAGRLGLDARCCGMPNHVHAIVFPNHFETLDGKPVRAGEEASDPMYLDPYRSDVEVPASHLRETLASWGIQPVEFARFIADSSVANLVLRTSRNILATVHEYRGPGENAQDTGHPTIRLYANPYADMDNAFYSALWANFMLSNVAARPDANHQRQFIPLILGRFERLFPMDASLVEQYICPLFSNSLSGEHWELQEALRVVRAADHSPKQLKARDTRATRETVKYKVGQVFRHKRYRYTAAITGWDIECGMNSDWIANNNVDSLSRGRYQSFYHALVEDTSIRYVAEENIEIIEPEEPIPLMSLAGRFFKRWDKDIRAFISNIRDEYPED